MFFSESAAEIYQEDLDFRKALKNIVPEARKIFNIKNNEYNKRMLVEKMRRVFNRCFDNFEDAVSWFVNGYLETPELPEFFQLIEKELERSTK